jgi:chitodextrinase
LVEGAVATLVTDSGDTDFYGTGAAKDLIVGLQKSYSQQFTLAEVPVPVPPPPAWSAGAVYNAGDQVSYDGSVWRATWWTQNQKPGDPNGPWQQMVTDGGGGAVWTPTRIFNAGDVVTHQGKTYKALQYTRNQAPGDPNGPWSEIATPNADGIAPWTPTTVYNGGERVSYNGHVYVARWYSRNQVPTTPYGPFQRVN